MQNPASEQFNSGDSGFAIAFLIPIARTFGFCRAVFSPARVRIFPRTE
jgi:hypothetical protein